MSNVLVPWRLGGRSVGYTCNGVFYIRRTIMGRKVRLSTGCVTEEAAAAEYQKFEVAPTKYMSPLGRRAFSGQGTKGSRMQPAASLDAWRRRMHLKYRITPEAHGALLESQCGRCAICGRRAEDEPTKSLAIDHDHATGRVRGLLCAHCNRGLGHFRDSPETLRLAAAYLERGTDSAMTGPSKATGGPG